MDHLDTRVVWAGEAAVARARRHPGAGAALDRVRLRRRRLVARRRARQRARPHLLAQHQPDGARVRAQDRRPGGRRARDRASRRAWRRSRGTLFTLLTPGLARRLGQGHLRRHEPAASSTSCRASRSTSTCATPRTTRRSRRAIARGLRRALPGDADQPDAEGGRHRAADRGRARAGRDRGRRQHLRDADQPAAAGARRRPRACTRASKFLGGHADALGGALAGRRELVERGLPLPRDHRRRAVAARRLHAAARHEDAGAADRAAERVGALRIAAWLEAHDGVEAVFYPGLESNVGHEIAAAADARLRRHAGASRWSAASTRCARSLPRLRLAHRAANLGAVETIAGIPATTSHVECTAEERAAMGIPEALVRLLGRHRGPGRPDRRPGAGDRPDARRLRRRQPPAVREGGAAAPGAARRRRTWCWSTRGSTTTTRWPASSTTSSASRRRPTALERRLRHATPRRRRACWSGSSRCWPPRRRTGCVVYGDTNSTLAGALGGGQARPAGGPRRGRPALVRPVDARGGEPRAGRRRRRPAAVPVRGRGAQPRGRGHHRRRARGRRRDGRRRPPVRPARRPASASRPPYVLATVHREANTRQPALGRLVAALSGLGEHVDPAAAPAHARRAGGRRPRVRRRRRGARAGRLPRVHGAAARRPGAGHRLRRGAEGGVLPRRPVRDAARHDRVGRDGRVGLERARRRRRDAIRAALARPVPAGRPALYGDGHAAERIAALLARSDHERRTRPPARPGRPRRRAGTRTPRAARCPRTRGPRRRRRRRRAGSPRRGRAGV